MKLSAPLYIRHELKYVEDVLKSRQWASGKYVKLLEDGVCKLTGSKYAIATNSGTSALHISLLINGIGNHTHVMEKNIVIVPTLSFIAPVNAIRYVGAEPMFVDCDEYGNIDVNKLQKLLQEMPVLTMNRIEAIMPVHLLGGGCSMNGIKMLAREYKLKLIEDCAEGLGAKYTTSNDYLGTFGDCGIYSFNANKIVTGGSGGMIVTNDEQLATQSRHLINQAKADGYTHDCVGFNYTMSDITAAVAYAQFEDIEVLIKQRKHINKLYNSYLKMLQYPDYIEPNYWFNTLVCDDPDKVMKALAEKDIQSRRLWGLCHEQKPYKDCAHGVIEKAYELYNTCLSLPSSNGQTVEETIKVIEIIEGLK